MHELIYQKTLRLTRTKKVQYFASEFLNVFLKKWIKVTTKQKYQIHMKKGNTNKDLTFFVALFNGLKKPMTKWSK